jgi:hypothetical protein
MNGIKPLSIKLINIVTPARSRFIHPVVISIALFWISCGIGWGPDKVLAGIRFVDNGDGTITDHQLGIMWSKKDNQADIGWKQAQRWAESQFGKKNTAKRYRNWRLPTIEELQSLYVSNPEYSGYTADCGFVVKTVPEIQISCVLIWASDTALGSHLAYNFNIGNPFTVPSYDIKGCRALAVRDLE